MIYWVIAEYHGTVLNSIRGPYNSQEEAQDHAYKCKAYRDKHPVPFNVYFIPMKTYPPELLG